MRTVKFSKIVIFSVCILLVVAVAAALLFGSGASLPATDKVIADAGEGADEIAGASYPVSADGYTHGSNIGRATSGTVYDVSDANNFVSKMLANSNIRLTGSFTLSSDQVKQIWNCTYSGTIYGNGKKITVSFPSTGNSASVTTTGGNLQTYGGLCGTLTGAIYDLTFVHTGGQLNVWLKGNNSGFAGGLVGSVVGGTIENVKITLSSSNGGRVGIVKESSGGAFGTNQYVAAGALAGRIHSGTVRNVTIINDAWIESGLASSSSTDIGKKAPGHSGNVAGIIGPVQGESWSGTVTIDNVVVEGSVTSSSIVGDYVANIGTLTTSNIKVDVTNFYNKYKNTYNGNATSATFLTHGVSPTSLSIENLYQASGITNGSSSAGSVTNSVTVSATKYTVGFDPKQTDTANSLVVVSSVENGGEDFTATIQAANGTSYTNKYAFNSTGDTVIFRELPTSASIWKSGNDFYCVITTKEILVEVTKLADLKEWESGYVSSQQQPSGYTRVTNGTELTNAINQGQNIYLANDITDFKGFTHTGSYGGTIEGNGHTIYIVKSGYTGGIAGGLFGTFSGTIRNTRVVVYKNFTLTTSSASYAGIIAANLAGEAKVENCNVVVPSGVTLSFTTNNNGVGGMGGIAGGIDDSAANANISNTTVEINGTIYISAKYTFETGFVGHLKNGQLFYTNVIFKGSGSMSGVATGGEGVHTAGLGIVASDMTKVEVNGYIYAYSGGVPSGVSYFCSAFVGNQNKLSPTVSNAYTYGVVTENSGSGNSYNTATKLEYDSKTIATAVKGDSTLVTPYFSASKGTDTLTLVAGNGTEKAPAVLFGTTPSAESGNYSVVTVNKTEVVNDPVELALPVSAPSVSSTDLVYNGEGLDVTINPLTAGSVTLGDGDYTLNVTGNGGNASVQDNKPVNAGDYTLTVTLNGTYAFSDGTQTATCQFSVEKLTLTGSIEFEDPVYDGSEKTAVFVPDEGIDLSGKTVSISYGVGDRTNVTTEGVEVTASVPDANYTFASGDTLTETVYVTPMTVTIEAQPDVAGEHEYNGGVTAPSDLFIYPKDINDQDLGLVFVVSVTVDGEVQTGVNIERAGEYTITANLAEGQANYTAAEKVITYKVIPCMVTITLNEDEGVQKSGVYNGNAVEQAILDNLFKTESVAAEGAPFELTVTVVGYTQIINAGEYTVKATVPDLDTTRYAISEDSVTETTYTVEQVVVDGTVTAQADLTYDGQAKTATFAFAGESPMIGDDQVSVVYSERNGALLTEGKAVNAGDYTATATLPEFESGKSNYKWETVAPSADFTIAKKAVTLTVDDQSEVYGDVVDASGYTAQASGVVEGQQIEYTVAVQQAEKYVVGTEYTLTATPTDATVNANYEISCVDGKLTVTKKDITATISAIGGTYNGQPYTASVSFEGKLDADELTATLLYNGEAQAVNADTYAVTVDSYGGADAGNYNVTVSEEATLTISPATLTWEDLDFVPAEEGDDMVYDGGSHAVVATVKAGSLFGEDEVSVKVLYDGKETAPVDAGTYTLTFEVVGNDNYVMSEDGTEMTIEQATVNITGENATAAFRNSAFTEEEIKTAVLGEQDLSLVNVTVTLAEDLVEIKNADDAVTVAIAVKDTKNYKFADGVTTSFTFTVVQAEVSLSGESKTAEYKGIAYGEDEIKAAVFGEGTDKYIIDITYNNEDGKALNAGDKATLKVTGYTDPNYKVDNATQAAEYTFTVTAKKVTLSASQNVSKDYDGAAYDFSDYTVEGVDGFIAADGVTVTVGAGNVYTPDVYDITVSHTAGANYEVTVTSTGKLTVNKATLVVEATDSPKQYTGRELEFSFEITSGVVGSESVSVGAATYKQNGGQVTPQEVGVYDVEITLAGNDAGNYTVAPFKVEISALGTDKPEDMDVDDIVLPQDLVYDGTAKTATLEYAGAAADEYHIIYFDGSKYSTSAPVKAGTYTVRVYVGDSTTQLVNGMEKQMIIAPKTLTAADIETGSLAATYDATAKSVTATVKDTALVNDDVVNLSARYDGSAQAPTDYKEGGYAVTFVTENANYAVDSGYSVTLNIAKASVTVKAKDATKTYYDDAPQMTYEITVGEFYQQVTVTVATDAVKDSPVNGTYKTYATVSDFAEAGNYDITCEDGVFTISAKTVTIDASDDAPTAVYKKAAWTQDELKALFVAPDDVLGADLAISVAVADGKTVENVDTYTLTASLADASGNYTAAEKAITFTVTPLALESIPGNDASADYKGTAYSEEEIKTAIFGEEDMTLFDVEIAGSALNAGDKATATVTVNDGNYTIAEGVKSEFTFTVDKATATVTVNDASLTYGTDVSGYGFTATVQGEVNGEKIVYTVSAETAEKYVVGTEYTLTATPTDAAVNANYDISCVSGKLTVTKKEITVTIQAATSVYGEVAAALTATVGEGAIVAGDSNVYELTTGVTKTSPVGTYDITGTALDGNYDITFEGGQGAYSVTEATITVSGVIGYTGTYDKTSHDALAEGYTAVTVNGQTATWSFRTSEEAEYATEMPAFKDAGEYTVWYKVSADNHNDYLGSVTVEIGQATVNITGENATAAFRNSAFTEEEIKTAVLGEQDLSLVNVTVTLAEDLVEIKNAGDAATVAIAINDTKNYKFADSVTTSFTFTVVAEKITLAGQNASGTYKGEAFGEEEIKNAVFGEDNWADFVIEISYNNEGASALDAGNVATVRVTGHNDGNYAIDTEEQGEYTFTVTAKSVTLKAEKSVEKTYDGAAYDFSRYVVTGADAFYARDNVTVNVDAGEKYVPGSYALNVIYSENANYSVTVEPTDAKLTIGKATLTIEAVVADKEYNGSDITFDFSITGGKVGSDDVTISSVSYKKGGVAATPNAIGAYVAEFTLGGAQAAYYDTGTVTVNVVAPTTERPENMSSANIVLPEGDTVVYDGEAHEAVLEYENMEGDTATYGLVYYLNGNPVDSPTGAGVYTVRVYKNDEIYLIDGVFATLTINPVTLTRDDIKAGKTDFTYSGASNKVTVSATGVKGEAVELKVLYEGQDAAPVNAGYYTVLVVSANANYVVAGDVSYGMNVARASVTTPQANALTYDGTEQTAFGEDKRYTLGGTFKATDVSADGYIAVFTLASDNYKWAAASDETQREMTVTWNIAPATVSITESDAEKTAVYNGNAFTAEQLEALFVAPDKVTTAGGKVALAITVEEGEVLNAGTYTVTADVDDINYVSEGCKVTFTVTQAKPVVNVAVQDKLMQQGDKLSTVRISLGEGSTAGTIAWDDPETLLVKGENKVTWTFVPADNVNYEGDSGEVTLTVGEEVLTSFEMTTAPDKTQYTAFEEFDATGMTLTATFDDGTVQEVTLDECDVTIENATADGKVSGATTKITVAYGNKTVKIEVTVSKVTVEIPTLAAAQFEYDATEKTVSVQENPLYTVHDGASATNVGKYTLRLALADKINYAWENGETYASIAWEITPVTVSGTITLPENLVYDGTAKTATFTLTQGTLYGGAQMTITYELPDGTKLDGAPVNAGDYEVVATLPDKTNYRFAEGTEYSVAMTIAKKEVSINTNGDREKYYDGVEVTAAQLAENFSVTDGISVKVTVSGTVLNAGSYKVTATIEESNYFATPTSYTFTVRKADRTAAATLEVKYLSLKVTAGDATAVAEYSLDGNVWLPLDGEIDVKLAAQYDVWVRYVATDNYNVTAPVKVSAKITKAILAQYAAERFKGEPTLADVADITALEALAAQADGSDAAFDETLADLSAKKQILVDGATAAVEKALRTGGALRGYAGVAVAVAASVSAIGIAAALGLSVKNRKGGKKNEKK